jgi:hypothetical protein
LKNKTDKVNIYVEFSGRQTGKTTRLIQRALLESYQNNVVIFVNNRNSQKRIFEMLKYKLGNINETTVDGCESNKDFGNFLYPNSLNNIISNKCICVISNFALYINCCYLGSNNKYSFFFEEAAFNSNIGFLSHKEILENIAPNGLLYFSTTLNKFLQKKTAKLPDFHEDPMQFLYEEFGIDVNLKRRIPQNCDYHDINQQKLEEGYLFKIVGQTTYE